MANLLRGRIYVWLVLLPIAGLFGQSKADHTWVLGYDYDKQEEGSEGVQITFGPSLRIDTVSIEGSNALSSSLSILSNEVTGELLFYSNGCNVFNRGHEIMENGMGLNPGNIASSYCKGTSAYYPNSGGLVSLPDPGDSDGYYLIHTTIRDEDTLYSIRDSLRYTYIDMRLDGGNGSVVEKNVVFYDQWLDGGLNACRHANGKDWWLLNAFNEEPVMARFLLDEEGISYVDTQYVYQSPTERGYQAAFSPDGSQYAWYGGHTTMELYDFDRSTGLLSNHRSIYVADTIDHGGLAFSPSGRFVYCVTSRKIYQVDLHDGDEVMTVANLELPPPGSFTGTFDQCQLAPNCKIYICAWNGIKYLHEIAYPDQKGLACEVHQYGLELPYPNDIGAIPYFPHFRVDEALPCTPTSVVDEVEVERGRLELYPNPVRDLITIVHAYPEHTRYQVYDVQGRLMMEGRMKDDTLDVSTLSSGLYVLQVHYKSDKKAFGKFVKR